MFKASLCILTVGLAVAPAWGQPRQWVDDFQTVATYDSVSLLAPCSSGPPPKYTLFEALTGDIVNNRAWSGGGALSFNDRSTTQFIQDTGRMNFAIIGWLGLPTGCPGEPPAGTSTEGFTSPDVCVYGAVKFSHWQCKVPLPNAWDVRGQELQTNPDRINPIGIPGVANVDDDQDGQTDEWNETPAARPTTVNSGYGNKNGTGYQAGLDAAPGVAGVDDNGNGIVDDVGETGWVGSDDGDDTQRQLHWVTLHADYARSRVMYLDFDFGSTGDGFSLRQLVGVSNTGVQYSNEIISYKHYLPETTYNWTFCVANGDCWGAMLWKGTDMANPEETLGPVVNSLHMSATDNLVGFGYHTFGGFTSGNHTPPTFKRHMKFWGNSNFSDTFWVVSGPSSTYYPSPSADLDADKDVDGFDFLTFSNCYNGSNKPPLGACANARADLDKDGDVDGFDFLTFSNCYNGSNRKPLTACFPPNLTTCGS